MLKPGPWLLQVKHSLCFKTDCCHETIWLIWVNRILRGRRMANFTLSSPKSLTQLPLPPPPLPWSFHFDVWSTSLLVLIDNVLHYFPAKINFSLFLSSWTENRRPLSINLSGFAWLLSPPLPPPPPPNPPIQLVDQGWPVTRCKMPLLSLSPLPPQPTDYSHCIWRIMLIFWTWSRPCLGDIHYTV